MEGDSRDIIPSFIIIPFFALLVYVFVCIVCSFLCSAHPVMFSVVHPLLLLFPLIHVLLVFAVLFISVTPCHNPFLLDGDCMDKEMRDGRHTNTQTSCD